MSACTRAERDLRKLFAARSPDAARSERVRHHAAGCARCASLYDRMVALERRLVADTQPTSEPSPFELARVQQAVLAATKTPSAAARARRMAMPALAALAAAVLAVVLVPRMTEEDTFQPRGAPMASGPALRLRAFCQPAAPDSRPQSMAEVPGPDEIRDCPRDGTVLVAYQSDLSSRCAFASLGADGALAWLALDVPIVKTSSWRPVPVKLRASNGQDPLRVIGVCGATFERARAALERTPQLAQAEQLLGVTLPGVSLRWRSP